MFSTACILAMTMGFTGQDLASLGQDPVSLGQEPRAFVYQNYHTPEKEKELSEWVGKAARWYRWAQDRYNRAGEERKEPTRPIWLEGYCSFFREFEPEMFKTACSLAREIDRFRDGSAAEQVQIIGQGYVETNKDRTTLFERIHVDGPQILSVYRSDANNSVFGFVGMHVSLLNFGRFQLYGPPGVMLISVPAANGSRRVRLAYTWGGTMRIFELRIRGFKKTVIGYFHAARAWMSDGDAKEKLLRAGSIDIVGISFSFKEPSPKKPIAIR